MSRDVRSLFYVTLVFVALYIPVVEGFGDDVTIGVEDDVLVLNSDNFDRVVYSNKVILLEFYAPWCGHCKALAPEFAKAAKILKENDPKVVLAKVDATVEEQLSKKFEVTGFPTLFYFKNGVKYEYDGPRTSSGIVEYMKEKADPNWIPPKDMVIVLTSDNFTEVVANEEIILVEFYAPWCGHCKQLAPEYKRAAKELSEIPKPIKLAKVDATVENELREKFDVKGFPTMYIFRKGKRYKYDGPREERGIVSYMKEQQKPPSTVLQSVKQILKVVEKGSNMGQTAGPTIVAFFDNENSPFYQLYIDAGNEQRDKQFRFFHTFDKSIREQLKEKVNNIVLFQPEIFTSKFEPSRYRLQISDETNKDEIIYFIGNNSLPLVGHRSYENSWLYENKFPLVVVYYDVDFSFDHIVSTQIVRQKVLEVANKYRGKITFAISKESEYESELKDLGLEDSGEDVNVGLFKEPNVRYAMEADDEFNEENLATFVENALLDKIPQKIKSIPEPAVNDGPVTIVVGSTFKKLVTETKKDVLIEFYAPWCGHCKALEPIYSKLGEKYKHKNDVLTIAKIDATSNDYPSMYEVEGYPTIYYLSAKNKEKPFLYNGERKLKDLSKFVDSMLDSPVKEEL
ncbi:Protein disulfide-isomerase A4-like protein [Leptotrombidium deliense]|uniref:Protein disulfide-isomerase n=1 Tax=Leptotrombidium deliense TaxID=299467 RepID=A0A443STW1_9ACAR|nr:Protein disulfide-isomerase A4-like protein [Leptotrombidium deliense]